VFGSKKVQFKRFALLNAGYYSLGMTKNDLQIVSIKLPASDVRRIRGNRSVFVREAVAEKLAREEAPEWKPKTAHGRKLLALRERFLAAGGETLDAEGIAAELRQRRGGVQ
jgi:hypothetical protein